MKSDFILLQDGRDGEEGDVRARRWAAAVPVAAALVLGGCATAPPPGTAGAAQGRSIKVVAAENFWGSIAGQVGGPDVRVTSLVDNPDADPHDYEPTPADARAVATADVVLVNGIGYDTWATRLVEADGAPGQTVVSVGDVVGARDGDNPHRWYDPAAVDRVAAALATAYGRIDPAARASFEHRLDDFRTTATASYQQVVDAIRRCCAGTPIGASESIAAMMTPALGLDLVTPPGFLKSVSEGTDPTAGDVTTANRQIATHAIAVYVYNSQNATPDVQAQVAAARAAGIPVTTITETMVPADGTWQEWQTAQLVRLRAALESVAGP
jgi:zinc/manganese transport system substrate-binding protein